MTQQNLIWHPATITKKDRQKLNGHKSCALWLTGYSGSGKSTVANELDRQLHAMELQSYVLDGDNVRQGLNRDLGFSQNDRIENIRRVGEVAKLFVDSGVIVMTAFISPYQKDRNQVRELFDADEFFEIYIDCPLEVCETRDPKGLYQKARNGEICDFTGIDSPYEPPSSPDLTIDTVNFSVNEAAKEIVAFLKTENIF
ncbi:adenylyl-sulfate kinase [Virgibacillus kekensis]|uniref:Adenylyl-sulfate kinase n=1 Tax=Virgibacillus kekensis TaxID=202261 RepID=A0ABV9DNZ8_9BACI